MCATWQWNARDCVTGLHDRRSRECNPVTPVECVSLSCRTYPDVLAFITNIFVQTELRWCSFNEFDTTKLLIFQINNLFHCVAESWWKMRFKGTRHGYAVMYVIVATLIRLFSIMTSRDVTTYCDVTQCMNGLWLFITKTWIAQGRLINISRTPSKQ